MIDQPPCILADAGDLIELLIFAALIIISAVGGLVKQWMEKKEQQDRQKSLDAIHEAKAARPPVRQPERRPVTQDTIPALQDRLRRRLPTSRQTESIPYATAYPESGQPAAAESQTRQERLADLQRKRTEYLNRIADRSSAVKRPVLAPSPPPAPAAPPGQPAHRKPPKQPVLSQPEIPKVMQVIQKTGRQAAHTASKAAPLNRRQKQIWTVLHDKDQLRDAFLLMEVLGKPIALREGELL